MEELKERKCWECEKLFTKSDFLHHCSFKCWRRGYYPDRVIKEERRKQIVKKNKEKRLSSLTLEDKILLIFNRYKNSAKKRGYSFDLDIYLFSTFLNNNCYYCGEKIPMIGIDRLINTVGYNETNCVPCCTFCNLMKRHNSHDAFIDKCKKIAALHMQQESTIK